MYLMMALGLTLLILVYTFVVRAKDLSEAPPPPPYQHLEGRKAAIYENLRDLQFEYRVGKLSDADYDRTKKELQGELARILAEIDSMKGEGAAPSTASAKSKETFSSVVEDATSTVCPHCSARFEKPLKFCGECGKPMGVTA
jgi:hypothetical protein